MALCVLTFLSLCGLLHAFEYQFIRNAPFLVNGDIYEISQANDNMLHKVTFFIRQSNVNKMVELLNVISDPTHANYAKYLTRDEIAAISANPPGTSAVHNFLHTLPGLVSVSSTPHGDMITAVAPIGTWQTVFNCKYEYFSFGKSSFLAIRKLFLPVEIADHVQNVFGTTQISMGGKEGNAPKYFTESAISHSFRSMEKLTDQTIVPALWYPVTPQFLNTLYNIPDNNGNNVGSQSVFETINETYSVEDLTIFETMFNLTLAQPSTIIGGHVDEGLCGGGFANCGEANLDVQYIMAMAQNIPTTYWYSEDGLEAWLFGLSSQVNPPLVNSISYMMPEFAFSQADTESFDTEAVIFSLMGITLFAAGGDSGASSQFVESDAANCGYIPAWPQTSPYVMVLGATQGYPEVVCSSGSQATITSGGGFSNLVPTASFQSEVVAAYFNKVAPPFQNFSNPFNGVFNASGRGYPDVSLQGAYYKIIIDGNITFAAGTSASTPVFAAMISLINSGRLQAGIGPVGWLNPALYMYANSFVNDITVGNNTCMEDNYITPVVCCAEGFFAAPGWDAATGLGTVNFQSMYDVLVTNMVPTSSPTTHHNSKTGKFFGIACAGFLFCVSVFTYVYNMAAINQMICGKAKGAGDNAPINMELGNSA